MEFEPTSPALNPVFYPFTLLNYDPMLLAMLPTASCRPYHTQNSMSTAIGSLQSVLKTGIILAHIYLAEYLLSQDSSLPDVAAPTIPRCFSTRTDERDISDHIRCRLLSNFERYTRLTHDQDSSLPELCGPPTSLPLQ